MNIELKKGTNADVKIVPQYALDGTMVAVVMIKAAFHVNLARGVVRAGDAEVRLVDEPWDEKAPETSSIRLPSDLVLMKPSTDVVVAAHAMAEGGAEARSLDVLVRVGPVERALRVHGLRVWYRGTVGLALTPPQPFTSVPLRWELTWGGSDLSDPQRPLEEPRNPVGRGVVRQVQDLIDKAGPQIDDPSSPAGSRQPVPAGVGPLGRHWAPRRQYVGTYDEKWMRTRMPLPPLDFDPRFNQMAPPELITPAPLRGGELVQLLNLNAAGAMQFTLPRLAFFVGARTDDEMVEARPVMDTLLLLPNERRFEMTWRACVPLPKRNTKLRYVQVHEKTIV